MYPCFIYWLVILSEFADHVISRLIYAVRHSSWISLSQDTQYILSGSYGKTFGSPGCTATLTIAKEQEKPLGSHDFLFEDILSNIYIETEWLVAHVLVFSWHDLPLRLATSPVLLAIGRLSWILSRHVFPCSFDNEIINLGIVMFDGLNRQILTSIGLWDEPRVRSDVGLRKERLWIRTPSKFLDRLTLKSWWMRSKFPKKVYRSQMALIHSAAQSQYRYPAPKRSPGKYFVV